MRQTVDHGGELAAQLTIRLHRFLIMAAHAVTAK